MIFMPGQAAEPVNDGKVLGSLDDGLCRQHLGHDTLGEGGGIYMK